MKSNMRLCDFYFFILFIFFVISVRNLRFLRQKLIPFHQRTLVQHQDQFQTCNRPTMLSFLEQCQLRSCSVVQRNFALKKQYFDLLEKGHRFGFDLVWLWSWIGFNQDSIWSWFGSELGHTTMLTCFTCMSHGSLVTLNNLTWDVPTLYCF